MTARAEAQPGPLGQAAIALEEALGRIEAALEEVRHLPLTSERKLRQAATRLGELSDVEERLRAPLAALGEAMRAIVDRQRVAGEALEARAREITERRAALTALFARYEALGREAAEVHRGVKDSTEVDVDALSRTLRGLADDADGLSRDAFGGGFPELAQEAHGLRQQLLSMRNRLALLPGRQARSD